MIKRLIINKKYKAFQNNKNHRQLFPIIFWTKYVKIITIHVLYILNLSQTKIFIHLTLTFLFYDNQYIVYKIYVHCEVVNITRKCQWQYNHFGTLSLVLKTPLRVKDLKFCTHCQPTYKFVPRRFTFVK